jgi:ferredoxin/flavodoxin
LKIKSVTLAYFSPTGTTKQVLEGIADSIGAKEINKIDLTLSDTMSKEFEEINEGLVILGAPVYAGRIPAVAEERFRKLKGKGIPAVIIVVYGNREYEDALLELRNIAMQQGFKPIAAGAYIGEHSYSTGEIPLAAGRPDARDIEIARGMGRKIAEKIKNTTRLDNVSELSVPGKFPYRERHEMAKVPPVIDKSLCIMCMSCIGVCPTASISLNEELVTDTKTCILCCACVKVCPTHARTIDSPKLQQTREWLSKTCNDRKEPSIFLG